MPEATHEGRELKVVEYPITLIQEPDDQWDEPEEEEVGIIRLGIQWQWMPLGKSLPEIRGA